MSGEYIPESLELRLERLKRLGNLRFDFLKGLYDRRSLIEQYESGDTHICMHFSAAGEFCAYYRAAGFPESAKIGRYALATKNTPNNN